MDTKRKRTVARSALAVVTAMAAFLSVVIPASPAQANRWHNIAGETFSNTDWFVSQNIRQSEDGGWIEAEFSDLITNGPLRFCIHNVGCSDFGTTNNEQTVAFVDDTEEFRNSFRRLNSCQGFWCNHEFEGQEHY